VDLFILHFHDECGVGGGGGSVNSVDDDDNDDDDDPTYMCKSMWRVLLLYILISRRKALLKAKKVSLMCDMTHFHLLCRCLSVYSSVSLCSIPVVNQN
jgi:hypothetical protein